jgi:hypothetical protein
MLRGLAVGLLLSALPATAPAHTRTIASGPVRVTLTWSDAPARSGLGVAIARNGTTLVDTTIDPFGEDSPGVTPWQRGVRFIDLGGEPEVVVDAYTGGAHCCLDTHVWWFDGAAYETAEHDWGNSLYRLGGGLFVGSDDRWAYEFSSYAFSRPPVLVLGPHLQDVTAAHPRIVTHDLRHQRHLYLRYRGRYDIRPELAAYVADLHSLGRHAEADAVLRRALRRGELRRFRYDFGPTGRAFIRALDRDLRAGGYMSRNSASTASTTWGSCGNAICSSGFE